MSLSLEVRERCIEAMRQCTRDNVNELATQAVTETKLGNVKDKIAKNLLCANKTPGMELLKPQAWTGDHGLMLMERAPFGVIGSITPTTNATETIINNGIAMVAGGNASVAALYALALTGSCRAFGIELPFATILFVNICVSYVVGLVPVPGSVGVAEAGLAAGLTAAGADPTVAVAAALLHRLITAWFPPLPGWLAMRYLERQGDI